MPTMTTNFNLKKPALSEAADIAVLNGNMDIIDSELATRQKKSTKLSITLGADKWTGTTAPFTLVLTVSGVTASTTDQEIYQPVNPTAAQVEAYNNAILRDGGQAANQITLKAYGDKPTIDIPIIVEVKQR